MVDRIVLALAKAEGQALTADRVRYRRLAVASLKPLTVPSEAMIGPPLPGIFRMITSVADADTGRL
jgi:hypothetical protein